MGNLGVAEIFHELTFNLGMNKKNAMKSALNRAVDKKTRSKLSSNNYRSISP